MNCLLKVGPILAIVLVFTICGGPSSIADNTEVNSSPSSSLNPPKDLPAYFYSHKVLLENEALPIESLKDLAEGMTQKDYEELMGKVNNVFFKRVLMISYDLDLSQKSSIPNPMKNFVFNSMGLLYYYESKVGQLTGFEQMLNQLVSFRGFGGERFPDFDETKLFSEFVTQFLRHSTEGKQVLYFAQILTTYPDYFFDEHHRMLKTVLNEPTENIFSLFPRLLQIGAPTELILQTAFFFFSLSHKDYHGYYLEHDMTRQIFDFQFQLLKQLRDIFVLDKKSLEQLDHVDQFLKANYKRALQVTEVEPTRGIKGEERGWRTIKNPGYEEPFQIDKKTAWITKFFRKHGKILLSSNKHVSFDALNEYSQKMKKKDYHEILQLMDTDFFIRYIEGVTKRYAMSLEHDLGLYFEGQQLVRAIILVYLYEKNHKIKKGKFLSLFTKLIQFKIADINTVTFLDEIEEKDYRPPFVLYNEAMDELVVDLLKNIHKRVNLEAVANFFAENYERLPLQVMLTLLQEKQEELIFDFLHELLKKINNEKRLLQVLKTLLDIEFNYQSYNDILYGIEFQKKWGLFLNGFKRRVLDVFKNADLSDLIQEEIKKIEAEFQREVLSGSSEKKSDGIDRKEVGLFLSDPSLQSRVVSLESGYKYYRLRLSKQMRQYTIDSKGNTLSGRALVVQEQEKLKTTEVEYGKLLIDLYGEDLRKNGFDFIVIEGSSLKQIGVLHLNEIQMLGGKRVQLIPLEKNLGLKCKRVFE